MHLSNWRDFLKYLQPRFSFRLDRRVPRRNARSLLSIEALEQRVLPTVDVAWIAANAPLEAGEASSVSYEVVFTGHVSGVDATDFRVVSNGSVKSDATINVASIDGVAYTVTIRGLSGTGDLRLDLIDDDSILDEDTLQGGSEFDPAEIPLGTQGLYNGSYQGATYQLTAKLPNVLSISRDIPTNDAAYFTSISYTVTFSESVTGVDATDFRLVTTGSLTVTGSIDVSGSGTTYTVSLTGIDGNGTVGLNLMDDDSIHDLAGNPLTSYNFSAAFQPPATIDTAGTASAFALGDLNADGHVDMITVNPATNSIVVEMGNGDGTFQPPLVSQFYSQVAAPGIVRIRDMDGDGLLDVVIIYRPQPFDAIGTGAVYSGFGDGSFAFSPQYFSTGANPSALLLDNFSYNERPQLIIANSADDTVEFLQDYEQRSLFNLTPGSAPSGLVLADLNGDGYQDVVTSNKGTDNISVFLSQLGDGVYYESEVTFSAGVAPAGVTAADLNGDGNIDLITANKGDDTISILFGNGDGTFQPLVTYLAGQAPSAVTTTDLNGDGKIDVVVTNSGDNTLSVYLGKGDGTFLFNGQQVYSTGSGPTAIEVVDVDHDGRIDLLTVNSTGTGISFVKNASFGDFTGETYTRSNSAPAINSVSSASVPENFSTSSPILQVVATDADLPTQTFFYSVFGTDAEQFTIDNSTGELYFNWSPDFENPSDQDANNVYQLTVRVSDGYGGEQTQDLTITVLPVNDNLPVINSTDFVFVSENTPSDVVVLYVSATDADLPIQTVTFSISGSDAARFTIDSVTGEVRFVEPPDYEAPSDLDGNNVYEFTVTADDGNGGTQTQDVTLVVIPQDDNPTIVTSPDTVSVPENTAESEVILDVEVTDADLPQTQFYFYISGVDAEQFSIDSETGEIRFLNSPDFEAPTDQNQDNVYQLTVSIIYGEGPVQTQDVTITVLPVNDNAPEVTLLDAINVDENTAATSVLLTAVATDADLPTQTLFYSLSGPDAALFSISNTGDIRFLNSPNFESPLDENGDNVYEISVTVIDNVATTLSTTRNAVIAVNDVNEPAIAIDGTLQLVENTSAAGQLVGSDPDVESQLTFFIVDFPSHGILVLTNSQTGTYTYTPDEDYTGPDSFTFQISDDVQSSNIATVAITVSPENSPPVAANATLTIPENSPNGTVVGTVLAIDPDVVPGPDSDVLTYNITGGNTNGAFSIDPSNGELRVANSAVLNFEVIQQLVLSVTVTDLLGESSTATITINITNVNEPLIITLPNAAPVYQRQGAQVVIDDDASVYDEDLTPTDFRGGLLRISITNSGNPDPQDRIGVLIQGSGPGKISLVSNYIVYDSPLNIIGTIVSGLDGAPLIISLTSFATEESIGALLQTITFYNTSNSPEAGTRTITFDLNDGSGENSGTQFKQIEFITTTTPPDVTLPSGDLNLDRRSPATALDSAALVTDLDSKSFKGGRLTVNPTRGANRSDRLRILNFGGIKVTGKDVLFNGQKIGRLTSSKNSITVDFNSSAATPAAAQALLRAITFSTTRSRAGIGERYYQVTLSDGEGGVQTATKTVRVSELARLRSTR